jgi:diguanylate cyclase (GGDEF)-like protein
VKKAVTERTGAEVVAALTYADTRAAVEQAPTPFDIALVDVVLPDAPDGEAVGWLVEKGISCVVFTGVFSEDLRERLLAQRAIDYVIKDTPSSLDYLIGLVERLQRNRETKVLVVDDSKTARSYVCSLLKSYKFPVVEASSAEAGLKALEADPSIRLVITDYYMPEMDGVEMVRRMRIKHAADTLAIIGVSSGGGSALSAKFIKHGANDFLNKPFLPEEFFCRVTQNVRMLDMVQRLTDMATRDALTGIHNRRYFFDVGAALFASAKREHLSLTAAIIDVDFFKDVNDTYGHDAGDKVLRHVAALLRRMCRQTDVVVRFGGEEFAILAVNMDTANVRPFFEGLRAAIESETVTHQKKSIPVTASFGVCHGAEATLEAMLKLADEALYRAKETGRNRVETT